MTVLQAILILMLLALVRFVLPATIILIFGQIVDRFAVNPR
jgi:hypothetical protein